MQTELVLLFSGKLVFISCFVSGLLSNMPNLTIHVSPRHSSVHRLLVCGSRSTSNSSNLSQARCDLHSPFVECASHIVHEWYSVRSGRIRAEGGVFGQKKTR
jgi:hypothetical protein